MARYKYKLLVVPVLKIRFHALTSTSARISANVISMKQRLFKVPT